jgi:transaldolase
VASRDFDIVGVIKSAISWKNLCSNCTNPKIIFKRIQMAKPNYTFEKRRKEIAKKKKKEEKRLQKAGLVDSQPQVVQPISDNDDKAATTDET